MEGFCVGTFYSTETDLIGRRIMMRKSVMLFAVLALLLGSSLLAIPQGQTLANIDTLPPCGEGYEPNDSLAEATESYIGVNVFTNICPAGDVDIYRFQASAGDILFVHLMTDFWYSQMNADLYLLDENGTVLIALDGESGGGIDEMEPSFYYPVQVTGTYYVKVTSQSINYPADDSIYYSLYIQHAPPKIEISPLSIQINVPFGAVGSEWLTIRNTGFGTLTFWIDEARGPGTYYLDDVPWLEVRPLVGHLLRDQQAEIEIRWTAQPPFIQAPGYHHAYLLVWNNDIAQWIHIEMDVHFYPVNIDVQPGNERNWINKNTRGNLSVAILSSAELNAPDTINPFTLTFGKTGEELSIRTSKQVAYPDCHVRDVNKDGYKDLICEYETTKTGLTCGDTQAVLRGKTHEGIYFEGTDLITVKPC
jgi:hypothetical protein